MAKVEYDTADERLLVRDVGPASRHPLVAAFTRQAGGGLDEQGVLWIPTNPEALTSRYQTLTRLLKKVGVIVETGDHVSDALDRVESEERRFIQFSRDAY